MHPGTYSCSASCVLDNSKDSMCTNADAWALSRPELPDAPKPTDYKMEPVPNNISCQDCSNHLNIQEIENSPIKIKKKRGNSNSMWRNRIIYKSNLNELSTTSSST